MTSKSSLGASKTRFKAFGPPFARLLDALGRILDAFGTLLAVSLASLGPLERFWKHLKCIWERLGSYMGSIWDPFSRFLRHILIKEPPRCLASRRGASQYTGVPNPMSVLNVSHFRFWKKFLLLRNVWSWFALVAAQ